MQEVRSPRSSPFSAEEELAVRRLVDEEQDNPGEAKLQQPPIDAELAVQLGTIPVPEHVMHDYHERVMQVMIIRYRVSAAFPVISMCSRSALNSSMSFNRTTKKQVPALGEWQLV